MPLEDACVILLAGGLGERVRDLYPDLPKPLIPVAGRPFIDWICRYWAGQGIRRIIVSLGHLAGVAEKHFETGDWAGVEISTVREERPLGTAGAIVHASQSKASTDPLIVANGDSLVLGDISAAWSAIEQEPVDGVLLGRRVPDAGRYGSLRVRDDGRLLFFDEKRPGAGLINAGVYFLKKRLLARFPDRTPLSIEREVFPFLLEGGVNLRVHPVEGDFLDIGTPQDLRRAARFIESHRDDLQFPTQTR